MDSRYFHHKFAAAVLQSLTCYFFQQYPFRRPHCEPHYTKKIQPPEKQLHEVQGSTFKVKKEGSLIQFFTRFINRAQVNGNK
jgi:hypothetical protein